jgi:hypothetical protein
MLCFVVVWRKTIEKENKSSNQVSQHGTPQQCVLPSTFRLNARI